MILWFLIRTQVDRHMVGLRTATNQAAAYAASNDRRNRFGNVVSVMVRVRKVIKILKENNLRN